MMGSGLTPKQKRIVKELDDIYSLLQMDYWNGESSVCFSKLHYQLIYCCSHSIEIPSNFASGSFGVE